MSNATSGSGLQAGGTYRTAAGLPNFLTYGRMFAVPIIVGCLLYGDPPARWAALVVYVIAGITDFFDGYLARLWSQQSALGRMLDPIADKLVVAAVLLMLSADGTIYGFNLVAALIILSREIMVSGLREFLTELRVFVPVTSLAKWKTAVQLVAIGLLIGGPNIDDAIPWICEVGLAGLWIAASWTLYTGYDYFRAGLRHLMESKN